MIISNPLARVFMSVHIIHLAEQFAKEQLQHDSSGHDWWHCHRVRQMALRIAKKEGADEFVCELAALLHDVADEKLNTSKEAGIMKVRQWLETHVKDAHKLEHVLDIIATLSYNGGHHPPMKTLEGQIVQDADRLDALGAIGIARAFAYAGWKGHILYDPEAKPREVISAHEYRNEKGTAINHFYEKLLKLKDTMNTEWGKRIALQRHQVMEQYLAQFYQEWDSSVGNLED